MGKITRLSEVLETLEQIEERINNLSDDFYTALERFCGMEDTVYRLVNASLVDPEEKKDE